MRKFLFFAVILVILVAIWHVFFPPKYIWYQRVEIVVNTPDGPKVGHGDTEVMLIVPRIKSALGSQYSWAYWGEAAVVDLGQGRYVFALLADRTNRWHPDVLLRRVGKRENALPPLTAETARRWHRKLLNLPRPLPIQPGKDIELAAFTDLSDPSSLVAVNTNADLQNVFGEGVSLGEMTLQIIAPPRSKGAVDAALPWLRDGVKHFPVNFSETRTFADQVNARNFIRRP